MSDVTEITVTQVQEGDLLDLYADPYVGGHGDDTTPELTFFAFEYGLVVGVERETADCVRIDIEGVDSFGFPPDHIVKRVGRIT